MVCASLSLGAMAQEALAFNANAGVKSKMTVYDGTEVSYTAYKRLFYVTNVENSAYQFLNVYVPDGARDRDTAFPILVNFATKLQNAGKDVDFLLAWNRPHSGDYALDELFEWIKKITK